MIPAPDYSLIDPLLNQSWVSIGIHSTPGIPKNRDIVGFLFFDQNIKRDAVSDFLENLDLLNEHSGEIIHFFLPGVSLYGPNDGEGAILIGTINNASLYHNTKAFVSFKREFEEKMPHWRYELGVELVVMDVVLDDGHRILDFDSAIFIKVEEFIRLKIVDRTTDLLTNLIELKRNYAFVTTRDLKSALQAQFQVNWFKGLVLALFPKSIQDLAKAQAVLGGGSALR